MISGNTIYDTRVYRIYHPQFWDATFYNTASYQTGQANYVANRDSNSLVWSGNTQLRFDGQLVAQVNSGSTGRSNFQANWVNFPATQASSSDVNTLDDYQEGTFNAALTCASGSATLDFTRMAYTKVGRQVTITGQIQVGSVLTPSGAVTFGTLPFPIEALDQRASWISTVVKSTGLVGTPAGVVIASSGSGASVTTLDLQLFNNNAYTDLGALLQANTTLTFNFSYFAAT
jgi:hypothetical protein